MRISDWSSDVCSSDLAECSASSCRSSGRSTSSSTTCSRGASTTRSTSTATAKPIPTCCCRCRCGYPKTCNQQTGGNQKMKRAFIAAVAACGLAAVDPPAAAKDKMLSGASSARSEEHTSELQSLMRISDTDYCLKKQ